MAPGIKSGAAGSIILAVGDIVILIATILLLVNPLLAAQLWYVILSFVATGILAVGVLVTSIGAFALRKHYQNVLPLVAGIIGIVGAIIGFVSIPVSFLAPGISAILGVLTLILLGVFSILLGVAFIILRGKIGYGGLALATGIIAIITGAFFCSVILSIVSIVTLIPTAILAAYLFMKAKGIPEKEPEREAKEWAPEEAKAGKPKEAKKLAVRPVEEKKPALKPEEIEEEVLKWVKKHPEGLDVAECAEKLGASEKDVEKAVNALVKKGKLATG